MSYLLPATVYQPPARLARSRQLNTIIEANEDTIHGYMNDSAVVGRPIALETKTYLQASSHIKLQSVYTRRPASVVSSEGEDDMNEEDDDYPQPSSRSSCASSDAGTVFSDSCPSLTGSHTSSDVTSFMIDSCRNSVSSRNSRNRYPTLLIPRGSWNLEAEVKDLALGMSPFNKQRLSPEALDRLPNTVPSADNPPSFGDASSTRSASPYLGALSSVPATPDIHRIDEDQPWGSQSHGVMLDTPLEIAIDDEHSYLLSAAEAHSAHHVSAGHSRSSSWNDIVHQFPTIPGATPQELTPVTPIIPRGKTFEGLLGEAGVELPASALAMLQNLNRTTYTASFTGSSVSAVEEEMQERSVPEVRPQTWSNETPVSETSLSQLSIPSPGGFFASLKSGARYTWCAPAGKSSPPPSSTTAENFYNLPWNQTPQIKETTIEYDGGCETDGPPTVRQATFNFDASSPKEDDDLYGDGKQQVVNFEYEEEYEQGLKQVAEININRTNDWLSTQDTYLSALRGSDMSDASSDCDGSIHSETQHAIDFLEKAKLATSTNTDSAVVVNSPGKETTFLQAFTHLKSETKRSDAFLHASSRLDSIETARMALPKRHLQTLLNTHTSQTLEPEHARPKYRGPFSQNPRNTGDFNRTLEQAQFKTLERERMALDTIKPNVWALEAQRAIFYNGRLTANRAVSDRITQKDLEISQAIQQASLNRRLPKVLDLAGAATASWAWAAAAKWSNATIHTVQTKQQAELARDYLSAKGDAQSARPQTPKNHKISSVPHLWQLPFPNNYFDIISARTLHMHLRANPVPGVDSIDEWDMTLKECMRVLRPGGVLDFFAMDSGISNETAPSNYYATINLSPSNMTSTNALPPTASEPKRASVANEFKTELSRRGYEVDGGCGRLMGRLKQAGFVGVRRQWIGLPLGSATSVTADGFRAAPRPISEASTISKILDPYADCEAVQGPVGSTSDVSNMSALLGELMWEEWLVRLRIESGRYTPDSVLDGVYEQFGEWRCSGDAAFRGVLGWARKPSPKKVVEKISSSTACDLPAFSGVQRRASVRYSRHNRSTPTHTGLTINTDVSIRRAPVLDWTRRVTEIKSVDFTLSAVERGEVGIIPMMIMG